jgi:protein arginine kinase activator
MPCPCQLCPSPEATVHLTEIAADGTRQELHVCRACMTRLKLRPEVDAPDLAEIRLRAEPASDAPADPPLLCDACGLSLASYVDTNLFGCPQCYESFDTAIMALLERYHGADAHQGRRPISEGAPAAPAPEAPPRRPRTRSPAARRAAIEARLRAAVAEERFEDAARLRDELKAFAEPKPTGEPS